MALEDFYQTFIRQAWKPGPDGFGGEKWSWMDGETFQAGLIFDNSLKARAAEAQGVTSLYTLMTAPDVALAFQDVVRRASDRTLYRITGRPEDDMPPALAGVQFKRVSAERVMET